MGFANIFRDFSQWTSAHGIPHIGSAQNCCLRVFWTTIFTASVCMFSWQMVLLLQKYLSYDVTVQTELKFEERIFPAVTICNLNPYINEMALAQREIKNLLEEYDRAMKQTPNKNDSRFSGLEDSIAIQSAARTYLMFIVANMKSEDRKKLYYARSDFIMNCAYNIKPCDMTNDFDVEIDPTYGICFKFNNRPIYNSTRAGPLYGLRILLRSNQSQYISLTESAGVRVSIHGQGEPPFPDAFGYNAATGFTTSFGVQFVETQRLPYPYGNCTQGKPNNVPYYYSNQTVYSTEACFRSCMQNAIFNTCRCADPRFRKEEGMSFCSPTLDKISCVGKITGASSSQGLDIEACACQQPCEESTYSVTVSTALWPSEVYQPPECTSAGNKWKNSAACQKWYGENTLLLEVYYERMNYQMLSEQEAYLLVNLISDMGGQLGLWMGFSVITMIEIIALFVLIFMHCCCKRHEKQSDDDKNAFDDAPSHDGTKLNKSDVTVLKPGGLSFSRPEGLVNRK